VNPRELIHAFGEPFRVGVIVGQRR
jgi:hypothetical protein